MKSTDNTIQGKYFQEASILLAHEGFDTHAGDGELLQVSFHGNPSVRSPRMEELSIDTRMFPQM